MEYQNLSLQQEAGILIVTVNRPEKLNAINALTMKEIGEVIKYAESTDEVRGLILTGAGEKAFVAGADIKEFAHFSVDEGRQLAARGHLVFNSIENCSKPVVAAVNGFALGAGCELAMACHIRVASDNAKFGQPEVALGVIPGYGGTQRLVQNIGKSKAFELLMTGDMIKADEALRLGLVNYVTLPAELLQKCTELLGKIMKQSPTAIRSIVRTMNAFYDKKVDGLQFEIDEFGSCFGTADFKEGTTAFIEKRKASFLGK